MNPKEVSYSHPQLPLCDTPIFGRFQPLAGIETQKYMFFETMQVKEEIFFYLFFLLLYLQATIM